MVENGPEAFSSPGVTGPFRPAEWGGGLQCLHSCLELGESLPWLQLLKARKALESTGVASTPLTRGE